MSEFMEGLSFLGPERSEINEQQVELTKLQLEFQEKLIDSNILNVAAVIAGIKDVRFTSGVIAFDGKSENKSIGVQARHYSIDGDGNESVDCRYTPFISVDYGTYNIFEPISSDFFTDIHCDVVGKMASRLKMLRFYGTLPDLSEDLTDIEIPS